MEMKLEVGMVVDDDIVMIENIVSNVEEGIEKFKEDIVGRKEVKGKII